MEELKSIRIDDFDAPLFIAWQITLACNLNCLHCCEDSGHSLPDELRGEEIFDFCRQIIELNIPYVALSGGEPLLHPDFFAVCELLRSQGINLKVETNGLFIDREVAKIFARLGFRSVQVSVDGATSSTHERMRVNGNFRKTIEACQLLIQEGVNTEIVFVPAKFNYREVGDLIDLAASMGVYGFYTGKIMRIGRAAKNWSILCPSEEEYKEFFHILEKKAREYEGRMKIFYYPYDVIEELRYRLEFPAASLLITPNGKVKLIGSLPFVCGDLRKQSLKEIWQNYKRAWKNPQVIEFAQKIFSDPLLLAQANNCIEIY